MATWGDYAFREERSNNTGDWLESSLVNPNGLVVIATSNRDTGGIQPEIRVEGVEHTVIADHGSVPYRTIFSWPTHRWQFFYWPWNYRRHWNWHWHRFMPVNTRVVLLVPHQAGTIRVRGEGMFVFDHRMRVFDGSVTPPVNRAIKRVAFSPSVQPTTISGANAQVDVQADDLLLATGTDSSPNFALANIAWVSGPARQELLNITPNSQGMGVAIRLWRIKAAGRTSLTYIHCNAGRSALRLMPSVETKTIAPPTVIEPRAYFEIQCEMDENGVVTRPEWFGGLYHALRNNKQMGIARAWLREIQERQLDTVGRISGVRARKIEHWTIPAAFTGSVG